MAMTPLILLFIKFVLRIPLQFSDATLVVGDDAIHGEAAYVFDGVPLLHGHHQHGHSEMGELEAKNGQEPAPTQVRQQLV